MKLFTFLMIFSLFATLSNAQISSYDQQKINEGSKNMSLGTHNSFSIRLVSASKDMAEDEWKDFIKNYGGKTKHDRKTKEYFTDDANISDLSDVGVDVTATFSNVDTFTTANFWFNLGGAYLSSAMHPERMPAVESLLKAYAFEVHKQVARENVKIQEKHYKDLEKNMKDLEKNNASYHKEIEEAKKRIAEMEQKIEQNLKDQAAKKIELQKQSEVLEKVNLHLAKYQ